MTVYSPYQDSVDFVWYVNIMTPNGVKKQEILNPLYYFQMMNVKPPIGSEFSDETVQDYQDLCAEAETEDLNMDYSTLEPYVNLNTPPFSFDSIVSKAIQPTSLPTVYMSINTKSISPNTSSLIPLTTPFVSIKSFNSSKTIKKGNETKKSKFDEYGLFDSQMETDEIEWFSCFEASCSKNSNLCSKSTNSIGTYYDEVDDYDYHDDNNNNYGEIGIQMSLKDCKKNATISNSTIKSLSYYGKSLINHKK